MPVNIQRIDCSVCRKSMNASLKLTRRMRVSCVKVDHLLEPWGGATYLMESGAGLLLLLDLAINRNRIQYLEEGVILSIRESGISSLVLYGRIHVRMRGLWSL